ncbi:putative protein N(5)-glutamine methyltransferase [Pseudarthrobacter sp. MEB009]|jgi:release factor glutamine methyltransferase|uniref:putative protein N(5)-glutamine methyltransferase n=1 Tax=Pseudarthrobacter sp. MEB009 TaxID=3040326 RepID=UPI002555D77D|nr:putative protein N(5)-glutamine methyltransferase [Pseudarthrobacter sp. MEB009]
MEEGGAIPTPEVLSGEGIASMLRGAGCVFAEDEARLLLAEASGPAELADYVRQRLAGIPLEYIVGWADFAGRRIAVVPGVFVPRRRTGLLVQEAADFLAARGAAGAVVVDLCCGSGAVGVGIAAKVRGIELHAADIDQVAVDCARRNIGPLGGEVHQGDLFEALPPELRGRVRVLAVNAPYVPSAAIATMPPEARLHETLACLDGGADGLDVHRRVAAGALDWLEPGGRLIMETSGRQAAGTASILAAAGLAVRTVRSADVDGTAVAGTAPLA